MFHQHDKVSFNHLPIKCSFISQMSLQSETQSFSHCILNPQPSHDSHRRPEIDPCKLEHRKISLSSKKVHPYHHDNQAGSLTAAMRSALRAPSSSLLEYLRIQSDICFFSPSSSLALDHARKSKIAARSSPKPRCLSTTVPRKATLEARFLNLGSFNWPGKNSSKIHSDESSRNRKLASIMAQRTASTNAKKWHYTKWYKKLWSPRSSKHGTPLQHDDLPSNYGSEEGNDTSMFSLGRHISAKAAAQPKLRCTELDENGNVVLASGEFKKSELIAKVPTLFRH